MLCLHYRQAAHRRPASAAVRCSVASASMEDNVCRPASLPVSHWFRPQQHHHATAHPHLRQDLMSTMHFSRPRSAQPCLSTHEQGSHADGCSSTRRHTNKHVQSDDPMSSCASPRQTQSRHVNGLAPSCHIPPQECSTAGRIASSPAPCNAACEAETVSKQFSLAALGDQSKHQQVQLQHLQTSCLPESSSSASSPDTSRRLSSREHTTGIERSSLQHVEGKRQVGEQAGGHPRMRGKGQDWSPQGARWRTATLYKLQPTSMHLPTAKVRSCCHALCMRVMFTYVLDSGAF